MALTPRGPRALTSTIAMPASLARFKAAPARADTVSRSERSNVPGRSLAIRRSKRPVSLAPPSASSSRQRLRLWSAIIRLAAFDLDGTLVRGQTCVEAIAAAIGRSDDCARFERLTMRDVPSVSAARETMAGWYEPYSRAELTAPLAELELAPGSEAAFQLLRKHGIETATSRSPGASLSTGSRSVSARTTPTARASVLVASSMSGRRTRAVGSRR
jgi:hypothetical protein